MFWYYCCLWIFQSPFELLHYLDTVLYGWFFSNLFSGEIDATYFLFIRFFIRFLQCFLSEFSILFFFFAFYNYFWTCNILSLFLCFNFSWDSFMTFLNSIFFTITSNSFSKFFISLNGGGHFSDLKESVFLLMSSSFPWNSKSFHHKCLITFSTFDINDNIYWRFDGIRTLFCEQMMINFSMFWRYH